MKQMVTDLETQNMTMANPAFLVRAQEFFCMIRETLGRDTINWLNFREVCLQANK